MYYYYSMKVLIYELRKAHNLTLEQLAEISTVSKTEINYIENNKVSPTLRTLELIANAFGCKTKDLYIE